MATRTITFSVSTSGTILGYWLAVGDQDIRLVNGQGSIDLQTGAKYILVWHMFGNSGSGISISGKDAAGSEVVSVKESDIPDGENSAAGIRRFPV